MTSRVVPSFHSEIIVVGAGVIGLAITRALAKTGKEVLVLEKDSNICTQTSSRNSEVIHAGLYYPRESAKAKFCLAGKRLLYQYCNERGITHRKCGKIVVATNKDQLDDDLPALYENALLNGVTDVQMLSREDIRALEPNVECFGGIFSPSTGILDSHSFYLSLLSDCQDSGATLILRSKVEDAELVDNKMCLNIDGTWVSSDAIINCAGLHAYEVAAKIHKQASGDYQSTSTSTSTSTWQPPKQFFAKGTYFRLDGNSPFKHLIYPVPEPGGLGVHATIDWSGNGTKFGPDVEWLDHNTLPHEIDYDPNLSRKDKFVAAIQTYYPALPTERLQPDYVGVRPKLRHPSRMKDLTGASAPHKTTRLDDFLIVERSIAKSRLFHLFGIESPGLTSSLGIAESIRRMLYNLETK